MKKALTITICSSDPDTADMRYRVHTRDYLDTLSDALYECWELQPVSRMWKADLVQRGEAEFRYGLHEPPVKVLWGGKDLVYRVVF